MIDSPALVYHRAAAAAAARLNETAELAQKGSKKEERERRQTLGAFVGSEFKWPPTRKAVFGAGICTGSEESITEIEASRRGF